MRYTEITEMTEVKRLPIAWTTISIVAKGTEVENNTCTQSTRRLPASDYPGCCFGACPTAKRTKSSESLERMFGVLLVGYVRRSVSQPPCAILKYRSKESGLTVQFTFTCSLGSFWSGHGCRCRLQKSDRTQILLRNPSNCAWVVAKNFN